MIILLTALTSIAFASPAQHRFQKEYPNGLVTVDYGILNLEDLKQYYDGIIDHTPFRLNPQFSNYNQWLCGLSDRVRLDSGETALGAIGSQEEWLTLPHITIDLPDGRHEFHPRRLWGTSVAMRRLAAWIEVMRDQEYVCISGSPNGDPTFNMQIERPVYYWTWDAIKSKAAEDRFWGGFKRFK